MRMLVLGAGLQGSACAYDLLQNPEVTEVRLADLHVDHLPDFLAPYSGKRLIPTPLDAKNREGVLALMRGADAVMIGRGAYGRPWLPAQVMAELGGAGARPDPSLDEQLATMLGQYEDMLSLYGTHTGVNLARKHIGWYTKGLPGSAELRNRVNSQDDPAAVVTMLREFYAPWLTRAAA